MNKIISRCIYTLALFLIVSAQAFATHLRAAEITYEFTSANTISASVIIYTSQGSTPRDSLAIHWGDGSPDDMVPRNGGASIGNNTQKSIYTGTHTFSSIPAAPGNFFIISMADANRNSDIINIANSVNTQLYVEDTIWFRGQVIDYPPLFSNPLTIFSMVGDTLFFNPVAYDTDGDSMAFDLVVPLQGLGNPVPGYFSPDKGVFMPGDTFIINPGTGLITWTSPRQSGYYDVAILVREYRNGILLGTALRDMLIEVDHPVTAIKETSDSHTFVKLYPNPVQDILHIASDFQINDMKIYSIDGRLIDQMVIADENAVDFTTKALAEGSYFIVIKDRHGAGSSHRFEIFR